MTSPGPYALPPTQSVLNSMEGVCYLVDFEGTILAIGAPNWDAVAEVCRTPHLRAERIVGANIYGSTAGEDVLHAYRTSMQALQSGREPQVTFDFRCDAPNLKREMRMTMTPVSDNGRATAVLFQSLLLTEIERPPMNIFDAAYMKRQQDTDLDLPLVTMCSYCHSVKLRGTGAEWVTAEVYYRNGGREQVRISHGMCPGCFHNSRKRQ